MQIVISFGIDNEGVKNIYNLPIEFFQQQFRVVIVGTLVLFLDVFLVILLYEIISKKVTPLFLRILFTMLVVLTIDTLLFSIGVFIGTDMFIGKLYAGFIAKYAAAIIYAILFTIYLKYIDNKVLSIENKADNFKDIFHQLTYKQKYKQVENEKITLFKELQESKIQFRTYFENDVNIIYIISPNGLLTDINPAFEKLTEWSVTDFINKPFVQLIHPEDIPIATTSLKNCLDKKEVKAVELRFLCKSGEYIFGEFTPILYEDDQKIIRVLGIVMDITARKNAEIKTLESEKRHRLIFENTLDGMAYHQLIFENDKAVDYIYLQVNNAFETQSGLKEVVGKKISDLVPNIHQTNPELLDRFVQVAKTGKPIQYETYIKQTKTWYFTSLYLLSNNIVVSVVKNITDAKLMEIELKESEELLRLSSELAKVAAWEYDFETDEMSRSKNHDSLYGLPVQEKWEFATFTNATHIDDRAMSTLIIQNAVAVGGPDEYNFDFRVIYPNKSIHWLNVIGKVIKRNTEGLGVLVRGFLIDITDRKQTEIQLIKSEKRYRALFENMSAGFVLFDVVQDNNGLPIDLIILAANKGFETTTGLNLQESIGKRLTLVLPGIEKDEADWIGTYSKVALTGKSIQFEQGSELLNVYYAVTAYQTEENQCAVLFDDISNRKLAEINLKQSEIHFRQLFENNPQIMWIYDLESLQFTNINETAIRSEERRVG